MWCLIFQARFVLTIARSMKKKILWLYPSAPELLKQAVYGLAEWSAEQLKEANLVAVPGCYPTAAQLSLKPLIDGGLLDLSQWPVINATSGVSGQAVKRLSRTAFAK